MRVNFNLRQHLREVAPARNHPIVSAEIAPGDENPIAIWRHGKSERLRKNTAHDFIGGKFFSREILPSNQSILSVVFGYGLHCEKAGVLWRGMYDNFPISSWKYWGWREIDDFFLSVIINHRAGRNKTAASEKNTKNAKDSNSFYQTCNFLCSHSAHFPETMPFSHKWGTRQRG
jgi:hypothetical protein